LLDAAAATAVVAPLTESGAPVKAQSLGRQIPAAALHWHPKNGVQSVVSRVLHGSVAHTPRCTS